MDLFLLFIGGLMLLSKIITKPIEVNRRIKNQAELVNKRNAELERNKVAERLFSEAKKNYYADPQRRFPQEMFVTEEDVELLKARYTVDELVEFLKDDLEWIYGSGWEGIVLKELDRSKQDDDDEREAWREMGVKCNPNNLWNTMRRARLFLMWETFESKRTGTTPRGYYNRWLEHLALSKSGKMVPNYPLKLRYMSGHDRFDQNVVRFVQRIENNMHSCGYHNVHMAITTSISGDKNITLLGKCGANSWNVFSSHMIILGDKPIDIDGIVKNDGNGPYVIQGGKRMSYKDYLYNKKYGGLQRW